MIRKTLEAKVVQAYQTECWDNGWADFGWETKVHPDLSLAVKTKSTERLRSLIQGLAEQDFANFMSSFFTQFGHHEL